MCAVAADVGEEHSLAVALSQQRCGIHAAVEDFFAEVDAVAVDQALPDDLARQGLQLQEAALAVRALLVHLAGGVEVGDSVLHAAYDGAVAVVEVLHVPHGMHGVQVDAYDVAVIISKETVVAVDADARLDAWRSAVHPVAQGADTFQHATGLPFKLEEAAVLACPEKIAASHDGRRVESLPSAPSPRVAEEGASLVRGQ